MIGALKLEVSSTVMTGTFGLDVSSAVTTGKESSVIESEPFVVFITTREKFLYIPLVFTSFSYLTLSLSFFPSLQIAIRVRTAFQAKGAFPLTLTLPQSPWEQVLTVHLVQSRVEQIARD
jgi:hypothetical protein